MECPDISVIIPVYNASLWLDDCLRSILAQNAGRLQVEISLFDDGSADDSLEIIKKWKPLFHDRDMSTVIGGHSGSPRGVGYAKNQAINQSNGKYLCFQDSDDIMKPDRLALQHKMCVENEEAIIGCKFERDPPDSTIRYTFWANNLNPTQLNTQMYTSHGPTVIMPTWFCSRRVIERVGGFDESGKGTPEDLIFFYKHLDLGGRICRVDQVLLTYRYHPQQATFSVDENTIWDLRLKHLEKTVLKKWSDGFTIWNAGKQGRKLYRSLSPEFRARVKCFCDVDIKKIQQGFYIYENASERPKPKVPIVHFSKAQKPLIICVKLGMTKGEFETNLDSLQLEEGLDYVHFN